MISTIRANTETIDKLKALRLIDKEPLEQVILRLLVVADRDKMITEIANNISARLKKEKHHFRNKQG